MDTISEIKQAIGLLSQFERSQIALWIHDVRETQMRAARTRVEEAAPVYKPRGVRMTVEEYFAFDSQSKTRYEYVAGELFAMNGASLRHNRITGRIFEALFRHLRGGPCQAYVTDAKVGMKVNNKHHFYYPDVVVTCDSDTTHEKPDTHFVTDPKLIVEVLSPSTENIDRREKWLFYQKIPTLEEYVVVAQEECEVTVYRREDQWQPVTFHKLTESAEFRSLALSLPLTHVYDDEA
jgi:Uma2 family endonuclease